MSDLLMEKAMPPDRLRKRKEREVIVVRRTQLRENPGEWFVWQRDAKNASYKRKVIRQILGLTENAKFSLKNGPYEAALNKNESDDYYTLYVRYNPKEGK